MTRMTSNEAIHQALRRGDAAATRACCCSARASRPSATTWCRSSAPARVRNTPLAEAIIAGTAVGAAASGLRPVIDLLFAPFLTLRHGRDRQQRRQAALPLRRTVLVSAGGDGHDRQRLAVGAQHNHNLEAMFVHAPGLKVVMPSDRRPTSRACSRPRSATTTRCCSSPTWRCCTRRARCRTTASTSCRSARPRCAARAAT